MDTVDGGKGKDKLEGGKGADVFMCDTEDTIKDLIHKKEINYGCMLACR